ALGDSSKAYKVRERASQLEGFHGNPALSSEGALEEFEDTYNAGDYSAALVYAQAYEKAIRVRSSSRYASALQNLALVYQARGKRGQAQSLFERALAINERIFGSEHRNLADILNNLG